MTVFVYLTVIVVAWIAVLTPWFVLKLLGLTRDI